MRLSPIQPSPKDDCVTVIVRSSASESVKKRLDRGASWLKGIVMIRLAVVARLRLRASRGGGLDFRYVEKAGLAAGKGQAVTRSSACRPTTL